MDFLGINNLGNTCEHCALLMLHSISKRRVAETRCPTDCTCCFEYYVDSMARSVGLHKNSLTFPELVLNFTFEIVVEHCFRRLASITKAFEPRPTQLTVILVYCRHVAIGLCWVPLSFFSQSPVSLGHEKRARNSRVVASKPDICLSP